MRHVMCLGAQSCLTQCEPLDCSPPGSPVHGISQARILAWVAIVNNNSYHVLAVLMHQELHPHELTHVHGCPVGEPPHLASQAGRGSLEKQATCSRSHRLSVVEVQGKLRAGALTFSARILGKG